MSALDELVAALQASLHSVQTARERGGQAVAAAETAVEAAVAFGRDRAIAENEALRWASRRPAASSRPSRRS